MENIKITSSLRMNDIWKRYNIIIIHAVLIAILFWFFAAENLLKSFMWYRNYKNLKWKNTKSEEIYLKLTKTS